MSLDELVFADHTVSLGYPVYIPVYRCAYRIIPIRFPLTGLLNFSETWALPRQHCARAHVSEKFASESRCKTLACVTRCDEKKITIPHGK